MGARSPSRVDLKILAATDKDPEKLLTMGMLREPLYHRFGRSIQVPPLRGRKEDIPLLIHYFLDKLAAEERSGARWVSHRAMQQLLNYDWPGNVRELEHTLETAASCSNREVLFSWDFELQHHHVRSAVAAGQEAAVLEQRSTVFPEGEKRVVVRHIHDIEKDKIIEALETTLGNATKAADLLGYSRNTILNKMDRYGIPRNYGDPQIPG